MLTIRVPEEREKNKIEEFMNSFSDEKYSLNNMLLDNSMIASIDQDIIGFSSYKIISQKDKTALLQIVKVKKEFQGQYIGDGLVKSILNLAENRGIIKVYVIVEEDKSLFFKKMGFIKRKIKGNELLSEYININFQDKKCEVFEAYLPEFFNTACKSKK